jgi:hypothetical protein
MYRWKTNKRGNERRISGNYCLMYRNKTGKRRIERRISGNYCLMTGRKQINEGLKEEYQVIIV